MAKAIMVQGTGSDVGKSILVCALCRIFRQEGLKVAPFKAQNMSNNSYVTAKGREMGRAQVAQAEAAGILPEAEMNPILLKPSGNNGSQIITMGRPLRHMTAHEYYENKETMLDIAKKAYESLSNEYDVIVIEGAGSPAEINIKDNDIVNMKIAEIADAPVILVTDIERGGSFAWIVGTLELLDSDERDRVKGVIINKFRGDIGILESGITMLEERIKKPVLGVLPYFTDIDVDDEDSVSFDKKNRGSETSKSQIDIVIIRLPRISNFTDFDILRREKNLSVRFVKDAQSIGNPDLIILPGTKNTIGDLEFIKKQGIADAIIHLSKRGTMVIGICGGYQMLGSVICDPKEAESETGETGETGGLGLIDVSTLFKLQKSTYQVKARLHDRGSDIFKSLNRDNEITGYEIHMGETQLLNGTSPFLTIIERSDKDVCMDDGAVSSDGNVIGSYLHGIFDNNEFRLELINHLRKKKGLSPMLPEELSTVDKEREYDKLADWFREHINMDLIFEQIGHRQKLKNKS
ncbi:MAG: cobyric acid synthase [Candidatus Scalindua sp.]|mgnify:CR=1 FL=1|jgi:adenosylcobyric acid synthase|nr:cobyric acid synthase [Candidatus Scalindua sp.]MBT5306568.1 cobyric acid synthase [Candidatus Scalindua sp.]MBT6226778.1 cobyric acid synthase [Candidatus Scalindua sp.]MBT7213373.1 cobyric acid synthase [Candidatus Scalindua sp.]